MSALLLVLLGGALIQLLALTQQAWPVCQNPHQPPAALAVALVSAIATVVLAATGWLLDHLLLANAALGYLQLLALACAALIIIPALVAQLPAWLGVQPQTTGFTLAVLVNPLVLGMALIAQVRALTLPATLGWALTAGLVQGALLLSMLALHERLQRAPVPVPFRQLPILLISAGIAALALLGFSGLVRE